MENTTIVALLIGAWSLVFAAVTTVLFIGTKISFRYWLGWLALAFAQLVLSVLMFVLHDEALILGISPDGVAVAAFATISLAVSVQLSISISGHQRMLLTLGQECAELRLRIEQLEGVSEPSPASDPAIELAQPAAGAAEARPGSDPAAPGGAEPDTEPETVKLGSPSAH